MRASSASSSVSLSALGMRQALLSEKVREANSRCLVILARGSCSALRSTRRVMWRATLGVRVEQASSGRGSFVVVLHSALSSIWGSDRCAAFRRCSHALRRDSRWVSDTECARSCAKFCAASCAEFCSRWCALSIRFCILLLLELCDAFGFSCGFEGIEQEF